VRAEIKCSVRYVTGSKTCGAAPWTIGRGRNILLFSWQSVVPFPIKFIIVVGRISHRAHSFPAHLVIFVNILQQECTRYNYSCYTRTCAPPNGNSTLTESPRSSSVASVAMIGLSMTGSSCSIGSLAAAAASLCMPC
jgi:hypothetical protein